MHLVEGLFLKNVCVMLSTYILIVASHKSVLNQVSVIPQYSKDTHCQCFPRHTKDAQLLYWQNTQ